jgi:protein phosphatase
MMRLNAAAASDVGRRRRMNEDAYSLAAEDGLFIVADGMGGHSAGHIASELAAREVFRTVADAAHAEGRTPTDRLRGAVGNANDAILAASKTRDEWTGMGTTLVALLAVGDRAALAHVGDSRAYLVRRGRVRQLTDDHSLVGELQRRGELTPDAAREHPHRHVLTRALGVRRGVEADLAELTLAVGDVFVLCTDGLTTHVRDEELAEIVAGEDDPQVAAKALVDLANARGGEDNVTVVIVRCESV